MLDKNNKRVYNTYNKLREGGKNQMKELVKMLIGGVVGVGIVFLLFYVISLIVAFVESHLILIIPMFIIAIVAILKI